MPDLLSLHDQRLQALDPLLPAAAPLPEPGDSGGLIEVDGGRAVYDTIHTDPESFSAIWSALEQHVLRARVQSPDSMAELLERWRPERAPQTDPGRRDADALLTWPSRDVDMVGAFRHHGLTPRVSVAVRLAERPTPALPATTHVRRLRDDDIAGATELWLQLTSWDNRFLLLPVRPSAADRFGEDLATKDRTWRWVAEDDHGNLVGMLLLSPPEESEWVQPLVAPVPVSYLGAMFVAPSHRGSGVGAAMVARAHAAADAAGVPAIALHYSALNPLSVPFWHRMGYRPLWTTWARPLS